ncbi:MAG: YdcF family protein [Candidatus Cloacimonetes bacterium]|nr:YdcF family protein [Candidatus Cloacimonadota bacterium]
MKSIERNKRFCLTSRELVFLLVIVVLLTIFVVKNIHPFLSIDKPVNSEILIVEGWLPDYALEQAMNEFNDNNYSLLITTGGPLLKGYHLSEYKTEAELAASSLKELGFDEEKVIAVPAPDVIKDRTYSSAKALKEWFMESDLKVKSLNLFSLGAHSRRSWILFQKALGDSIAVGIISAENLSYDPEHWWKSSDGVRTVIGEMIACIYARFFFHPKE